MKDEQILTIDLLRAELGTSIDTSKIILNASTFEKLMLLSAEHTILPLVCDCVIKNKLTDNVEFNELCSQVLLESLFRQQKHSAELAKLNCIFTKNKIPYIVLKGAVLRSLYPEPYLRISCDIDILIKNENLDKSIELLKDNGYTYIKTNAHDVSFDSENGVHIELHFNTIEKENTFASVENVLKNIWDYATVKSESFEYVLSNEMFYFYFLAHTLKHFKMGGCGIRSVVDIWLLNNKLEYNNFISELLEKGGILNFAQSIEKLADVWFGSGEHNNITKAMEEYILNGGVYGTLENHIAMSQAVTDSKFKSLLKRIFLRYDTIKFIYPILKKHKWLMPFYQVRRWCKLIFIKEHRNRSLRHINTNQNLSSDAKAQAKELRDYFNI